MMRLEEIVCAEEVSGSSTARWLWMGLTWPWPIPLMIYLSPNWGWTVC